MNSRFALLLAVVQGAYFAITGLWPLVSIRTFLIVTGPKIDLWLVRAVGVLVLAIGLGLLAAAWRRRVGLELWLIAVLSAAGLAAVDVVYFLAGVLAPVYLLDAVVEVILIAGWTIAFRGRAGSESARHDTSSR